MKHGLKRNYPYFFILSNTIGYYFVAQLPKDFWFWLHLHFFYGPLKVENLYNVDSWPRPKEDWGDSRE